MGRPGGLKPAFLGLGRSSDCWWEKLMRRLADRLCDAMPAVYTSFLRSLKNSFAINPSYPFAYGLWRA